MNAWDARLREHEVWGVLEKCGPLLDGALQTYDSDVDTKRALLRAKATLEFVGKRLSLADPFLTPLGPLNRVCNTFKHANSAIESFKEGGDPAKLGEANSHIDDALENLAAIPIVMTAEDIGALRAPAMDYRKWMESTIEDAWMSVSGVTDATTAVKDRLNLIEAEIKEAAKNQHDAIAVEIAAIREDLNSVKSRSDSIIAEFQSQFSSAQDARQHEFSDLKESWRQESLKWHTDNDTAFKNQLDVARTSTETLLRDMNVRKGEIENLVGIIGNLGMTSGYQKVAASAELKSRVWQTVTVLAILSLIVMLALLAFWQTQVEWPTILIRILITAAFGALAAYSGTQADRYMEIERSSRKLELELQALGPYLAPLPEEHQQDFRMELAKKVFGRRDVDLRRNKSPTNVFDVVATEEMRDLIGKTISQLKEVNPDLIKVLPELISYFREAKK